MATTRKSREPWLIFQVAEDSKVDGFMIGPGGALAPAFEGKPLRLSSAQVEINYPRDSGKRKVLFRAPIDPQRPSIDPNAPLLDYHDVFGVDTNTREVGGTRISIACVVHLARQQGPKGLILRPEPVGAVELHNVRGTPADVERVVWRLLCERLTADPNFRPDRPTGLVVDSSLGALDAMNRRVLPVIDDWLLPAGFTLLFATSDARGSTVGDMLIRECEWQANTLFRTLQHHSTPETLHTARSSDPWTHFRTYGLKLEGIRPSEGGPGVTQR